MAIRQGATADHRTVEVKKPKSGRKEKKRGDRRTTDASCVRGSKKGSSVALGCSNPLASGNKDEGWDGRFKAEQNTAIAFSRVSACVVFALHIDLQAVFPSGNSKGKRRT